MTDTETLINTLIANGLASSRSEAQRMAESMISTSNKVNESMRNDTNNSMVKDYGEARRAKQAMMGTPQEQKIEELRQNALNPQPVNVQTEFDTPANDARRSQESSMDFTAEVNSEMPSTTQEQPVQASSEVPAQPQAVPTMTPEEYAARQMQGMGAQTARDLISEAPVTQEQPIQAAPEQPNFVQEELASQQIQEQPSLEAQAPTDFISQEPSLSTQPVQEPVSMQQEPIMPAMQAPAPQEQQPMSQSLESAPLAPQEASMPAQAPMQQQMGTPVATQPAPQEQEPEKKKSGMTEEEKKLADEVDLSKVFNFSNR